MPEFAVSCVLIPLVQMKMFDKPERPLGAPDKLQGYEFFRKTLGNPRHIAAPMVRSSCLASAVYIE